MIDEAKIFEIVGGRQFFENLVKVFYEKIVMDDLLRPMYPESLEFAEKKLFLFIMQRFGGPREYEKLRGHAMLRKRHFEFPIGINERDRWMELMEQSMEDVGIDKEHKLYTTFIDYFAMVATKMINKEDSDENKQNLNMAS